MKKNNTVLEIISVIICLLPILAGVIIYKKLPNDMPIHFDVNNAPDNSVNKNIALFAIPTGMAVLQLFLVALIHFTSKRVEKLPKIASVMCLFVPALTIMLYTIMITYSLGYEINVAKCVFFTIGIIFCILGNYMPKMSYESARSMMHPAPRDEKSHRKTVKWYGYSFVFLGIVFLIAMFFV